MHTFVKQIGPGLLLCVALAGLAYVLGVAFPLVGGAVFALLAGMVLATHIGKKEVYVSGIAFSSKKILQLAVVLLGFGLDVRVLFETGRQSLPIILSTIATALLLAFLVQRYTNIKQATAILVGVGSAICGGSAIAATAPVIEAEEEEVAQAIAVIFFFNLLAALLFPMIGQLVGFSTTSGEEFGLFAGTAINDTSSVTAAATTWDSLHGLDSQTLTTAVTVKLTRTLAIIPITLWLASWKSRSRKQQENSFSIQKVFPVFILFFIVASLMTSLLGFVGMPISMFQPIKQASRFLIMVAMAAIGLKTNLPNLLKNGKSALLLGLACWVTITIISLVLQSLLGLI